MVARMPTTRPDELEDNTKVVDGCTLFALLKGYWAQTLADGDYLAVP